MPREKDFDNEKAIEICTRLFASHGYSGTGIQQIVDATGINRSSLYSTFKGKEELFLTCLKKSIAEEATLMENLHKKHPHADAFIGAYTEAMMKEKPGAGLLTFAYTEFNLLQPKSKNAIKAHHTWKLEFIEGIIAHGQKHAQLSKRTGPDELGYLVNIFMLGSVMLPSALRADKNYKKIPQLLVKLTEKKKA